MSPIRFRAHRTTTLLLAGLLAAGSLTGIGTAVATIPAAAATATVNSVTFKAPVHTSYDHTTGGGAYNDGSVTYVKGELQGTNYACGDIASFVTELTTNASPTKQPPPYTVRITLDFTLDSTGQSGVALVPLTDPNHLRVNGGVIAAPGTGTGTGGSDGGFAPAGSGLTTTAVVASSPPPITQVFGTQFTSGAHETLTFWVEGVQAGTTNIIRSDAQILCQSGSTPTGNLQTSLLDVTVTAPGANETVSGGAQTINFRGVGNLAGLSTPSIGVVKNVQVGAGPCPATPTGVTSISSPTNPLQVTYCYYVTNYAAVAALGVTLVDDMAGIGPPQSIGLTGLTDQGSGSAIDLAGGGTTATGSLTTTLTGGGSYVNTATADATNATAVTATTATVVIQAGVVVNKTVTTGSCPSSQKTLSLVESATPQSVRYCFRVSNYSGGPAFDVSVSDDMAGLAPPQTITLTGLTDQGSGSNVDLAAGANAYGELVVSLPGTGNPINTATLSYLPALLDPPQTATSAADVHFIGPTPELTVAKVQTSSDPTKVGDTIAYTILATNTGNVTLTGVTVTDPNATITSCSPAIPVASLAAGAAIECQARHVVTQADVDSGQVVNAAIATGTGPDGVVNAVTDTSLDVVTPITASPALTTTKIRTSAVPSAVGQTISYTVKARNTGNVTLTNVTIADPNATIGVCVPTIPVASLAPGAEITCVATHTVTQADVDAGQVLNTATATGTAPAGPPGGVTDPSEEVVTPVAQAPEITITKTQTSPDPDSVGDVITYTLLIQNTGNTKLNDVSVTDPNATIGACTETLPLDNFLPGDSFTCPASHTVTRADMNTGQVDNVATAAGTSPGGSPGGVTDDSPGVTTPVTQGPALSITKERSSAAPAEVGDVVTYSIIATNTGNVDLTSVVVTDANATLTACIPANPTATLVPDATIVCSATHIVTQADLDAGEVVNQAVVTGTAPGGTPGGVTSTSLEVVDPLTQDPGLQTVKDRTSGIPTALGQVVSYTITATNTGNVTLTNVSVTDPTATITGCAPAVPVASLAPDAFITCVATHTVTQADLDAGQVSNTALATGTPPGGPPGSVTDPSNTVVTPVNGNPELTTVKTRTSGVPNAAGDVVTYSIVATNTGNLTLTNVQVTDANAAITSCAPVTPVATLAPGAAITCTATHTVTNADVTAGKVENTATAIGTRPSGTPDGITDPSNKVITPVTTGSAIEIVKSRTSGVPGGAGDVITYALVITNVGATTLTNISVTDTNATLTGCTPSIPVASLVPGGAFICTAEHTVTAADVTAGEVRNTADAEGTGPGGPAGGVTDTSNQVITPVATGPGLAVTKNRTSGGPSVVGDVITYSIRVANSGNVTLTNVSVADAKATISSCTPTAPVASMAPGDFFTCTATYTVTQADIDVGRVLNVATGAGTPPGGPPGSITGSSQQVITNIPRNPRMETIIDGPNTPPRTPGQIITYTVRVRNTGNTTLTGVVPQGKELVLSTCVPSVPATLLPGQEIVCQATHTVSTTEVAKQTVTVEATAVGTNGEASVQSNVAEATSFLPGYPSKPSGILAFTGLSSSWLPALGAVAVGLGAFLVVVARRRRRI